jgi:uncharacterized protein YegP (UPF0339 family)
MTYFSRPMDAPDRTDLGWDERWKGDDDGVIAAWERGRAFARERPDLAEEARAGVIVELPWRRETYVYLAMWQGLRHEALEIDFSREYTLTCPAAGKSWTVNQRLSPSKAPAAGRFDLVHGANAYRFVLKAGNHEVLLTSESYTTKSGAQVGIASVKTNAALPERFERRVARSGKPYFVLKAGNHEIVGQSQMYASDAALERGIAAVQATAPTAPVREVP